MAEIFVKIPEEIEELANVSKINWQIFVERKIKEELEELVRLKRIIAKSKLTENDVEELSNEVDMALAKRFKESIRGKK
jgi:t-SNARE complex subunit (syntaxin)